MLTKAVEKLNNSPTSTFSELFYRMIFCPSTNPTTNQKLTKSLTEIVETGTPHKMRRPKGAAHKLIISFSVTSMRRLNAGAQGGETFASRDPAKP